MNLIKFADATNAELFELLCVADNNNCESYLFNDDAEKNMYITQRYKKYEELGGRDNILRTIADACQEIQHYVDHMLAIGYEDIIIERNNIRWYPEEDGEHITTNIVRQHNNVYSEFNNIEDSIKDYYRLGNMSFIDLFIY